MQKITVHQFKQPFQYQRCSPIRNPTKSPMRAVSPLKHSPFSRKPPMSPIRMRRFERTTTPSKSSRGNQRVQFTKPTQSDIQCLDINLMQKTIKSGVGLFQQLVNQQKIGLEKKQNKCISKNINPFDNSEKKEQLSTQSKSSFGALIQNVKEIQSVQVLRDQYSSNLINIKNAKKSKDAQGTLRSEHNALRRKNTEAINILDSFASLQPSEVTQKERQQKNFVKKFEIKPQYEFSSDNSEKKSQKPVQPETKPHPQVISSFEDVILLIKKATQKAKDDSEVTEEDVKISLSGEKDELSFNMNPFL